MRDQHCLPVRAFGCYKADRGTSHRLADRFGIGVVVLLAPQIGTQVVSDDPFGMVAAKGVSGSRNHR